MHTTHVSRSVFSLILFFLIPFIPAQAQHESHQPRPAITKPAAPAKRPATAKPPVPKSPATAPAVKQTPLAPPPRPAIAPDDTTQMHMASPETEIAPDTSHRHHQAKEATDQGGHGSHDMGMSMTHSFSRNLPMTRNGSGTGWMPDATPMYAYMKHLGNWGLMMHGAAWLRYNRQNLNNKDKWDNGRRGGSQFDAPNWFMGMAQRQVGEKGLFTARLMMSLDPLTVGGDGYPLLFQTGETFENKPLIDRQHPHDLFSEIGVGYTHMLSDNVDVFGYVGYPGEPALGPNAFMHRISAFHNPDAPLGHHWQDATHIIFGVATAGVRYKSLKLEASNFTGREPDEHRYNFDKPRFDSYSYRVSLNPSNDFALQFSQGFLKSPEILHPDHNVTRTTASVLYSRSFTPENHVTGTLAWGLNDKEHLHKENSLLAEGNLQIDGIAGYLRYEYVQKDLEELFFGSEINLTSNNRVRVQAITMGTAYKLFSRFSTDFNLGIQGTVFRSEEFLEPYYGKNPFSAEIYLQITPSLMKMVKSNYKTRPQTEHLH